MFTTLKLAILALIVVTNPNSFWKQEPQHVQVYEITDDGAIICGPIKD